MQGVTAVSWLAMTRLVITEDHVADLFTDEGLPLEDIRASMREAEARGWCARIVVDGNTEHRFGEHVPRAWRSLIRRDTPTR